MSSRRIHIRPPGVKTGSTIGPFGPFRGRLGIQWVIGAIAVGLVAVLVVTWLLFRAPGGSYEMVGTVDDFEIGTGREVLGGVFLGRTDDGQPFAVAEPVNCPLEVIRNGYEDCTGRKFWLDGRARAERRDPLVLLPIQIHRNEIYVDPTPAG